MFHNSCYLTENKRVLRKFIFVFRDMSLCLLWLFMSPRMTEQKLNERLYKIHSKCTKQCSIVWNCIQTSIDNKLNQMN